MFNKIIRALCVFLAIFMIGGCSKDKDNDVNVPAYQTKLDPNEQDDDDRTLNEPAPARYPSIPGNGILWKPVSDSTSTLAVLLDPKYGTPGVYIKNTRNQVVAKGDFVGLTNPNRATYRFPRSGKNYSGGYLIVGQKVFSIGNGSVRQE